MIDDVSSLVKQIEADVAEFKAGNIPRSDLDAVSNACGKIISARKTQLEYQGLRNKFPDMPEIKWLEEVTV